MVNYHSQRYVLLGQIALVYQITFANTTSKSKESVKKGIQLGVVFGGQTCF